MALERMQEQPDEVATIGNGLAMRVVLYNDSVHSYDDVVKQLMKAISCSQKQAFYFAYEVDHRGLATVYTGDVERCLDISRILCEIDLIARVEC